jgi:hypothetical protein
MVAEMSTLRWAWTFPFALTLAWRSARPTLATCTSVTSTRFRDATQPPTARATTRPAMIQRVLRFIRWRLRLAVIVPPRLASSPGAGARVVEFKTLEELIGSLGLETALLEIRPAVPVGSDKEMSE